MTRTELYDKIQDLTRVEEYFRSCFIINNKMPSVIHNKNSRDKLYFAYEEMIQPSNYLNPKSKELYDYSWEAGIFLDYTVISYNKSERLDKSLSEEYFNIREKDIAIIKDLRYLDLINLESDVMMLYYLFKGKNKIQFKDDTITLEAGNVIFVAPNVQHSIYFIDEDAINLPIVIRKNTFNKEFFNMLSENDILSSFFADLISKDKRSKYLLVKSPLDDNLSSLLLDIMIEQESNRIYSKNIIKSCLELFFYRLISDHEDKIFKGKDPTKSDIIASTIIRYMRENYANISISEISNHFFLSESYICRLLKQKYGKNYIQMLNEIKLNRAKELLSSNNLSIEEICSIVGYKNSRHFRQIFKQAFNLSPSEYRAMEQIGISHSNKLRRVSNSVDKR